MSNRTKSKKRRRAQAENKGRRQRAARAAADGEIKRRVASETTAERAKLAAELKLAVYASDEILVLADSYLATVNVTLDDYVKASEAAANDIAERARKDSQGLRSFLVDALEETKSWISRLTSPEMRAKLEASFAMASSDADALRDENARLASELEESRSDNASLLASLSAPDGVLPKFLKEAFRKHRNRGFTNDEFDLLVRRILRWMNDMGVKGGYFADAVPGQDGPQDVSDTPESEEAGEAETSDSLGELLAELRAELEACTSIKKIREIAARYDVAGRSWWKSSDREEAIEAVLSYAELSYPASAAGR